MDQNRIYWNRSEWNKRTQIRLEYNRIEYNGVGGLRGMKIPIPRKLKFWNKTYYEHKLEAKAVNEKNIKKRRREERDKQIYINS